ncbi:MAG: sugar phosphate isomerase/epimerase [Thaumarchaeota archaeon]|jgi:sugar phosphate isomerase/epimerase|nr:sugar phosphate isomerase/epimerase [Nitrososphaerota archaeon]
MSILKIGAQLIIWGTKPSENLDSVLTEVKEAGYEGIETSPEIVSKDIIKTKRLLRENSLRLVALHMGVGDISQVEQAAKLLEELDGEYLTFSGPGGKGSEEDYLKCAEFLNKAGKICREHGIKTCYHNHGHEIANDQRGIGLIMHNTEPELVGLCVDTYWVKFGGADPLEFIKANRERIVYLHLKDGSEEDMRNRRFSELGRGSVNFPAILSFVTQLGLKWVVVEQDWTRGDPFKSMSESRSYLRKIGY